MAGAVGAGGIGDLAISYGYQRFDTSVVIMTVIVLLILVDCTKVLATGYRDFVKLNSL